MASTFFHLLDSCSLFIPPFWNLSRLNMRRLAVSKLICFPLELQRLDSGDVSTWPWLLVVEQVETGEATPTGSAGSGVVLMYEPMSQWRRWEIVDYNHTLQLMVDSVTSCSLNVINIMLIIFSIWYTNTNHYWQTHSTDSADAHFYFINHLYLPHDQIYF